jgi:hypothetical protein
MGGLIAANAAFLTYVMTVSGSAGLIANFGSDKVKSSLKKRCSADNGRHYVPD